MFDKITLDQSRYEISYHLTNTYFPTLTLLIIAELTLFFDKYQTELAIGFSLMTLLVMYNMTQFHQHSTYSFSVRRSQKSKKTLTT